MTGIPRKIVAFVRWLFASEQLPPPPSENQNIRRRTLPFLRWAISDDELARREPGKTQEAHARSLLQWVLSPERLPDLRDEPGRGVKPTVSFWPWVLGGEVLPELKLPNAPDERRPTLLGLALSPEVCPTSTEPTCRRKEGFLRRVLSSEVCPTREPATRRRDAGFMRWALSSEVCPTGVAVPSRSRSGFLRWLTAPEKLVR